MPSDPPARPRRRWPLPVLVALLASCAAGYLVYCGGEHQGPGEVTARPLPAARVAARTERQRAVEPAAQILFGDLHVHTTFSADAFLMSLPLLAGEGAHPPADACDFARYCSDLDFFALTDHAEMLSSRHWQESKDSIRQCNAVAGDGSDPDLVAFMGFEWTQVGLTPETHYGHKNVIFRDIDEARLPTRPIGATRLIEAAFNSPIDPWLLPLIPLMELEDRDRYTDLAVFVGENRSLDRCPGGVDVRALPADCRESASTPAELFEKLDQWGFESLVIPHGTTWGFYTPPGYVWDKQIARAQDDPARQRLVEVYSGHGNSEEYRAHRAVTLEEGSATCPDPTDDFEPCCHRAGEIVRSRCGDASPEECERRVVDARRRYAEAGSAGRHTLPGTTAEAWGDCDQCTDCFAPAFNHRPGGAVQYMIARGDFEDPAAPRHQVLGFIASSDNHTARPGTGYKELERRRFTEAAGPANETWRRRVFGEPAPPAAEAVPVDVEQMFQDEAPFRVLDVERQASFFLTGGLVAVHAEGRSRAAIWEALNERRVYGTSGDRILLWFDLIDAGSRHPMGSEVRLGTTPRFRVRAAGAFVQRPGCPEDSIGALSSERLEHLCAGECYHPTDERQPITHVDIVRIRPQRAPEEDVAELIEDAWRRLPCPADRDVCEVEVTDDGFVTGERDVAYYARAVQAPTPAVNARGLRCEEDGSCDPCWGDYRTDYDEDCLAEHAERAWSSPIWVRFDAALAAAARAEATRDAGPDAAPEAE